MSERAPKQRELAYGASPPYGYKRAPHTTWSQVHYEKMAALIASLPDPASRGMCAAFMAQMFAEDSVRFDSARFATACGLGKFEPIT